MKVRRLAEDRSILTTDGIPALVNLNLREATSAPEGTRLKATLTASFVHKDEDGDECQHVALLPFAEPTLPSGPIPIATGYTPEFRLEMN